MLWNFANLPSLWSFLIAPSAAVEWANKSDLKFCHPKKPTVVAVVVKAQHDFIFIERYLLAFSVSWKIGVNQR
jgi:hypothetical protein